MINYEGKITDHNDNLLELCEDLVDFVKKTNAPIHTVFIPYDTVCNMIAHYIKNETGMTIDVDFLEDDETEWGENNYIRISTD